MVYSGLSHSDLVGIFFAVKFTTGDRVSFLRLGLAHHLQSGDKAMSQQLSKTNQGHTGLPAIQYRAPIGAQDIRDTFVIKELDLFLITNLDGNVPPGNVNGLGLYYRDTRYLSTYELVLEGITPIYLLSSGRERFTLLQELTNPDLITMAGVHVPRQVIRIQRQRVIGPQLWEEITFANFHVIPLELQISLSFGADFADMFDIRGLVSHVRGTLCPPRWLSDGTLSFEYQGIDGVTRTTRVSFDPAPTSQQGEKAEYLLTLPARAQGPTIKICVAISPGPSTEDPDQSVSTLVKDRSDEYAKWLGRQVGITSDNPAWDATVSRARFDVRLLSSVLGKDNYPAAGVPWYVALFGRDALITALQLSWFPSMTADVLRVLANRQGKTVDDWKDEQPGKILHELRRGEFARANVIPFSPYYGTVDATMLFVILLERYYSVTGDVALLQELSGPLAACLGWMEKYGDVDGDGFIEYKTKSPAGLRNQ